MILHERNDIVFRVTQDPLLLEKAKMLRHDVYLHVGYIKEAYPEGIIPDEKDSVSEYLTAVDQGEEVVGTLRIAPLDRELLEHWKGNLLEEPQTLSLISAAYSNLGKAVELGALTVKKTVAPRKVSWGIYKSIFLYSLIKEIDYWVIGMDSRALRAFEMLGWKAERVGKPIEYFGSISEFGIICVRKQLELIFKRNPRYYNYVAN